MVNNSNPTKPYRFPGFTSPYYTQVPDVVFDELMPILSGAELKVLLYIIRRTFGFKKDRDNISLSQMASGIKTRDGNVLDGGTGLGKSSVARALMTLEEKNIIVRKRRTSSKKGNESTTYTLNVTDQAQENEVKSPVELPERPLSQNETRGGVSQNETSLVPKSDTQETVLQETEQQHVVVADLLIKKGISKGVAKKLAKQVDPEYVQEKILYLEFLLAADASKVKNPKGWLRSAIEQDFAAPDGFKSAKELAAQEAAQKESRKALEVKKRQLKAEEKAREAEEAKRAKLASEKLTELEKEHGTTDEIRERWKYAKDQAQLTFPPSIQLQTVFQSCHLLEVVNGEAVFACFNKTAGELLETKFERLIKRQLQVGKNDDVEKITAVFVSLNGDTEPVIH